MAAPSTAPCQAWTTWERVVECHDNTPELPQAARDRILMRSTLLLSRLSQHAGAPAYGICTSTIRPCRRCSCGRCDDCDCHPYYEITLADGPVNEVLEVRVNGEVFTDWQLDNWTRLIRTDGFAWPYCQNVIGEEDDEGVFQVQYSWGLAPPEDAIDANSELAFQMALASCGDKRCQLPQRMRSLTREGVSVTFLDPMDFLDRGRTGIYVVDLWLSSFNVRSAGGGIMHPGLIRKNRLRTSIPD